MGRLTLPLVLLATFALAACGVKGPLEPPPGAPGAPGTQAPAQQGQTSAGGSANVANWNNQSRSLESVPGSFSTPGTSFGWGQSNREDEKDHLRGAKSPNRPFILDGLL